MWVVWGVFVYEFSILKKHKQQSLFSESTLRFGGLAESHRLFLESTLDFPQILHNDY